jgi:hypothetical protein
MIGPFLIKLVEQPDVLGHYLRDPQGAMDAEGLSDSEREILLSGNLRRLREALQEEYPDREVFLAHIPGLRQCANGFRPRADDRAGRHQRVLSGTRCQCPAARSPWSARGSRQPGI